MANTYSSSPQLPALVEAGIHSKSWTDKPWCKQKLIALIEGAKSQMYGLLIGAAMMSRDRLAHTGVFETMEMSATLFAVRKEMSLACLDWTRRKVLTGSERLARYRSQASPC
jgi:hypothetical protein